MRNLKIFSQSFFIKLREILAYRFEFITSLIGPILINTTILTLLWKSILAAKNQESINGMSLYDFILYYYTVSVIKRIISGDGIGYISRDIYFGELNKYLLYPTNYQVFKWGTYTAPSFIYLIQLLVVFILHKLTFGNTISYENFFLGCSLIGLSTFLYFLMMNIIEYLAFWHDNIWSLGVAMRAFLEFAGGYFIPLSFFSDSLQNFLNYTPFPYMLYYPVQIILGNKINFSITQLSLIVLAWIFVFTLLNRIVWKKGNLQYTGVGI